MVDLRHAVTTAKMTIVITRRSEMAGCFPNREMYPSSFFIATTLPRKLSVITPVLGAQKDIKTEKLCKKKFLPVKAFV